MNLSLKFLRPLNMIGLSKMHCFRDGFLFEFFFRVCWDQGETLLMWMQMPAITSFEHKLLYSLLCQDRFLKWKDICFVGRHTWLLFSCFFFYLIGVSPFKVIIIIFYWYYILTTALFVYVVYVSRSCRQKFQVYIL